MFYLVLQKIDQYSFMMASLLVIFYEKEQIACSEIDQMFLKLTDVDAVATAQSLKLEIGLTTSSASGLIFLLYQATPTASYIAVDVHQNQVGYY